MAVKTSAAFTKAVMNPGRDFTLSMVIGASKENFDVANILSLEIIESATSKKGVKIGQFCKNECKLTVLATAYDAWQGNTFQLYLKLAGTDDIVPLGKYWVYEINTDDNYKTVVTAYDIPSWWAEAYSIKDTSVSAILATMESQSGQTITNKSLLTLSNITEVPEKATNQDMLAYIAGYDGYSVRTDRNGSLELYKYEVPKQYGLFPSDTLYPDDKLYPTEGVHVKPSDIDNGLVISQDKIFQSGLKVAKSTTNINSVTISNGTDNYTFGNGYGIAYYNPYIKSKEQASKCAAYLGFRYSAMTVKYIGNPALQAGDAIMVEVAPDVYSMCLIMEQKISFDGGLGITLDCYSDEADTLAIGSESPTMKKVEARYNELQTLIADMTKTLMGSERGYYRLLAADFDSAGGVTGYHTLKKGEDPAGYRIMNTPEYTSVTHGWQFTLQGLWYSNDGFRSFTNADVGLTMDGKLMANLIRANSIIGGVIKDLKGLNYWNLDTGEFHLSAGATVGDSTIANKADITASSEAITTSISKTYTTKADAQSLADTAEANAKSDTADKLKDYSTTVQMQSAIKQQADSITATVSKTYTTKADAQTLADTAEANAKSDTAEKLKGYSTTTEMNSAIKQQADSITASVSKTYTTKADAQSLADTAEANAKSDTAEKLKGYSTTTEMNSAITAKANEISLSVSKNITETKAYADNAASTAESNAKSDTADKLKSYSTTTEMNSAITAKANEISLSVSKTYQTMDGMSSYTKKAEIITAINNDTSNIRISADKLSLVFGDDSSQQIEMKSITDGVVFHGNGRIQMDSRNQMGFWNYFDTSHSHLANTLILQNRNVSNPGILLANYRSNYDLANSIKMWNVNSSIAYNQIEFKNYQYNGTSTANRMTMESSGNYGNLIAFRTYNASQVERNTLYMNTTTSSTYMKMVTHDSSGHETAELYLDQGIVGFGMNRTIRAYVGSDGRFTCWNGAYEGYGVISSAVSGGDGAHPISFGWNGNSLICWVDTNQVWSTSDARMKKNIKSIENDYLDAVGEVELKEFNFNAQPYDQDVLHFGVVAQNLILHLKKHNLGVDKLGMVYRVGKPGVEEDELAGAYCVDKEEFLIARVAYDEKRIAALEEKLKEVTVTA